MQSDLPKQSANILARMRAQRPRVHCITNNVAQNFTANMLLAAGAVPSMTISAGEIASFAASADALLVNLGTFDAERREAIGVAIDAGGRQKPWVLDPVLIERSPPRAEFARELIARGPAVVRLNHGEFDALAACEVTPENAAGFARENRLTVALSAETDLIADGRRSINIRNGHEWMAKVTAMGCAGSALTAACLAVEKDAWIAAASALLILGVAGEIAAGKSKGPGSLTFAILDVLNALDGAALAKHAKVE